MTAEKTGLAYRPPAQRVAFTFRHLLSQIQIIGRIDPALAASGVSATIRSVKLYGMPGTGECAVQPEGNGTWSLGEATDADNPFARDPVSRELTPAGISVFADDLLLFPQQVGDGFVLEIESQRASASPAQALAHGKRDAATAIPSRWATSTSCSRNRRSFPGLRPRAATSR